jgi:hypothetical protein
MMRTLHPFGALALVGALASCQQTDQQLPFELDGGGQQTIGISGGLISIPPSFSLEFPAGSLAGNTNVTADHRLAAFPSTSGTVVPGFAYDIGPAGTQLSAPARVQIAVPPQLLATGQDLSLAVALITQGGSIVTQVTSYDLVNGFLTAYIDELGPVAAVVATDAIPVGDIDDIPNLGGGSIAPPSPASTPVGPAGSHVPGSVAFNASCSTSEQRCFSSGIVSIWVDDVVRNRLGADIVLFNTTVDATFEFYAFNLFSVPTQAYGWLTLDGELRTRLNSVIAGRRIGDEVEFFTGNGTSPSGTAVTFSGNLMTLALTSEDDPEALEYSIAGVGTGEQLTVQFEGTINFSNPSPQPPDVGQVVVQVRLRR